MLTLLVITDGRRPCLEATLRSAQHALPRFDRQILVNDCLDRDFQHWLDLELGSSFEILHPTEKRGFAGAIQAGWEQIDAGIVYHLEDDFTHNGLVPIRSMAAALERHPELVQLALRRQPWNDAEHAAGGIVEQHPDAYTEIHDGNDWWLEHRLFFTTNPSLYRAELCQRGWPQVPQSEGIFTHQLLEDPNIRFGFWGRRGEAPRVHHIGTERVGVGY